MLRICILLTSLCCSFSYAAEAEYQQLLVIYNDLYEANQELQLTNPLKGETGETGPVGEAGAQGPEGDDGRVMTAEEAAYIFDNTARLKEYYSKIFNFIQVAATVAEDGHTVVDTLEVYESIIVDAVNE